METIETIETIETMYTLQTNSNLSQFTIKDISIQTYIFDLKKLKNR